ncbi:GGDEF domain-containing protein [Proteiniclasticum sp. C24MP]|uniref:GGDEF domain-containing protein n=1 Tax=Proteiniclasticum sp. C24MP TaxID=3374101 RepID=UPI003754D94B
MYAATYLIDIAALIFLMGMLRSSTAVNPRRKKPFAAGIILTVLILSSEAATIAAGKGNLDLRHVNMIANVIGFALTPLIPVMISLIFDRGILKAHRLILLPTILNIMAVFLSPRYGLIFQINENNQYARGDYFFLFIIAYVLNFLILVVSTLDMGKTYNYPIVKKLMALSVFTILGTSIQLVVPSAYSSWHSVTLALGLYLLLLSEFDTSFDTLTGLYNRSAFDKAVAELVKPVAFSVIILDINDFKNVNDTYGHDYGDQVIKTVASIVRASFTREFTCYRYGGDEFSIISRETDVEKIESHLKDMTTALKEVRKNGIALPTVSYGYSVFHGGEDLNFHKTLKEADDQMYHYKKAHKAEAAEAKYYSDAVNEA